MLNETRKNKNMLTLYKKCCINGLGTAPQSIDEGELAFGLHGIRGPTGAFPNCTVTTSGAKKAPALIAEWLRYMHADDGFLAA